MQKKYVMTGALIAAVALGGIFYTAADFMPEKKVNMKVLTPARAKAPSSEKEASIAARVNGEVITIDEIRQGYMDNPQIAAQVPFDDFYEKALDVFVNGKLLYQAAQKAKVESLPAYKEELKTAKEDIARKVYLESRVDEIVTPEAVEKFYQDEYVAKFVSQKEMKAKHILVKDEKTAKEVIAKLSKNGDFDKLAEEYTKDKTVDLGYFTEDLMVPEFVKAAKALKPGEYTKTPVKTQFGYHVILLEDVRDSAPLPVEDLAPQIKNILGQQAVEQVFENLYENGKVEKFDLNGNLLPKEVEKAK